MESSPKPKKKISLSSLRSAVVGLMLPRWRLLLVGLLLILVNRFSGLVLPGSTKILIDRVIAQKDFHLLHLLLFAVGGAILIQAVTSFLLTQLLSIEGQRLISELRTRIQKHMLHLPVAYFDSQKTGALVSRIMTDVEGVRNLIGTGLLQLIGGTLTAVVSFVILLKINVLLTLFTLGPLAIFSLISINAFKKLRPIFRQRGALSAEVTGRLTETLGGIRVIKGFFAEGREEKVFEAGVGKIFDNVRRTMTATSLVTSGATLLMGLGSLIMMGFGGTRIILGEMTIGDFFAFTLYLGFLVAPIIQMANIGTQISEALAGLDRMDETLTLKKENDDPRRIGHLEKLKGDFEFDNVRFAYGEGEEVIHDISFRAPAGSVTAFVGSSGSGKTTLAGLAASFLTPKSGVVRIDGMDLSTVKLDDFRRRLAVVLQDDFLFDGTIRENILFARPDADEKTLNEAAEAAYVSEFTHRFEKGLDTIIGERGVKLSGGQRQRVAIARALLADPQVLILDEATSSLDAESEGYIQESLTRLLQGRTTFVIAHRLSTIRRADQILVVEKGEIVERGGHDDLIARKGRYFDLYNRQLRI